MYDFPQPSTGHLYDETVLAFDVVVEILPFRADLPAESSERERVESIQEDAWFS